jgi:biotin carboxyl carrier protein
MSIPVEILNGEYASVGGQRGRYAARITDEGTEIWWQGRSYLVVSESSSSPRRAKKAGASALRIVSQMPGTVLKLNVQAGDSVQPGQALLVMESMKMEMPLESQIQGVVKSVLCQVGQRVERNTLLIELEASGG